MISRLAEGYPGNQPFNVGPRPNKKRAAWYKNGKDNNRTKELIKAKDDMMAKLKGIAGFLSRREVKAGVHG
jgi:hypothetical protein